MVPCTVQVKSGTEYRTDWTISRQINTMFSTGGFLTLTTLVSVISGFAINLTDIEVNDETTKNITGPLLLNLFDSFTNLTVGVDHLFDEFQEGFEDIRPSNYSDLEDSNITDNTPTPLSGSSVVVGLFDTLRDITGNVGDVVTDLGAGLADKRQDVVEAAHHVGGHVDSKVGGSWLYRFLTTNHFQIVTVGSGLFSFAQTIFQRTKDLSDTIASTIHRRTKWQE